MKTELTLIVLIATCSWLLFQATCLYVIRADKHAFNKYNDGVRTSWEARMSQMELNAALATQQDFAQDVQPR